MFLFVALFKKQTHLKALVDYPVCGLNLHYRFILLQENSSRIQKSPSNLKIAPWGLEKGKIRARIAYQITLFAFSSSSSVTSSSSSPLPTFLLSTCPDPESSSSSSSSSSVASKNSSSELKIEGDIQARMGGARGFIIN